MATPPEDPKPDITFLQPFPARASRAPWFPARYNDSHYAVIRPGPASDAEPDGRSPEDDPDGPPAPEPGEVPPAQ